MKTILLSLMLVLTATAFGSCTKTSFSITDRDRNGDGRDDDGKHEPFVYFGNTPWATLTDNTYFFQVQETVTDGNTTKVVGTLWENQTMIGKVAANMTMYLKPNSAAWLDMFIIGPQVRAMNNSYSFTPMIPCNLQFSPLENKIVESTGWHIQAKQ